MKQTELKRTGTLKRKRLRRVSAKQRTRNAKYKKLKDAYMYENPVCEFFGCQELSVDCHHMAGRIGNNMFRHFMAVCRYHHAWIHSHAREVRELGYLITDDPRRED